jgi:uncharacterized protein YceH (UPF0502 family)
MLPAVPTLDAAHARVVGSLIEKQLTTPQQYPLTLNALVSACNQSSNRDPVVAYTEDQVAVVLDQLKEQRLVRFVLPSHGRSVVRYRHVLDEALGIDQPQLAVLAVLLLRGPQTVGELRIRTDRMASFDSLAEVQHELDLLAGLEQPLVVCQPRRPGQKEERWVELLSADQVTAIGEPPPPGAGAGAGAVGTAVGAGGQARSSSADVVAEVWQELARLAADVAALRTELQELRDSLGG